MKYDQEKLPAGEKEYYSYINNPKYPFIRSNHNLQMVEVLLQSHIFPIRMTLEEEMYILEKHRIHSGLWLESESARKLIRMYLRKDTIAESNDKIKNIQVSIVTNFNLLVYDDVSPFVTLNFFGIPNACNIHLRHLLPLFFYTPLLADPLKKPGFHHTEQLA
jgi:hypothetical protein